MPIHRDPVERRLDEERSVARENNSAAGGLLLGITIAALLGLAGAAFYFMNQRQESPTQILPIPVPNTSQPQSQPRTQEKNTTIIDKTIEKTKEVVPVPQQQAPASQQTAPKAPEININVPNPTNKAPDTNTSTSPSTPSGEGADPSTSNSQQ